MKNRSVVMIGAGNVAFHLAKALKNAGYPISQVYSRTMDSASGLAEMVDAEPITNLTEKLDGNAEIYIVSINDNAIPDVLENITISSNAIIIHTSGSNPIQIFNERFNNTGVLYPLQTFSKFRPVSFDTLPLFVEGNTKESLARVLSLARNLSSNVQIADSQQREKIHVAGVFVNNFVNYFYTVGAQYIKNSGFGFEVLKPLIMETALKAVESTNPKSAQTGPAARNNVEIIKKHINLLASNPEIQNLYTFVSENILKTYHNQDRI